MVRQNYKKKKKKTHKLIDEAQQQFRYQLNPKKNEND